MLSEVKAVSRGLYSVCDDRSGSFNPPFVAANDSVAQRAFVDASLNTRGVFHDHPEDFSLFKVGEFFELTGVIEAKAPLRLMCGTELKSLIAALNANKDAANDDDDGGEAA